MDVLKKESHFSSQKRENHLEIKRFGAILQKRPRFYRYRVLVQTIWNRAPLHSNRTDRNHYFDSYSTISVAEVSRFGSLQYYPFETCLCRKKNYSW